MRSPRLKRVCSLGVVVGQKEVSDPVVQGIVKASFSLKGVSVAQRPRL